LKDKKGLLHNDSSLLFMSSVFIFNKKSRFHEKFLKAYLFSNIKFSSAIAFKNTNVTEVIYKIFIDKVDI
jgi:hypothetical protein